MQTEQVEKVELHCHSDCVMNPALLRQLHARQKCLQIPEEAVENACPVSSWKHMASKYGPFVGRYLHNQGAVMADTLALHIEHLKQQHVIYTEIMLFACIMQYADLDRQMELFKLFRDTANRLEGGTIQVEFLLGLGRTSDRGNMEQKAERALQAQQEGYVCGVALAGQEDRSSVKPYADIFQAFQKAGLGIEIHAGEQCGPESVWDALEYGRATRIGHGLAVFDDPVLLNHITTHDIHLEICPTSNLVFTDLESLAFHPLERAMKEHMNHSINTDDPGPLECTMNSEYGLIAEIFSPESDYWEQLKENGLRSRFAKALQYRSER